ncbi:regulatory protein RecX [Cysteiniphilum sp. QT6929]|uniref:regulatory protein RecX n=1 Tax=Cysteiniphilum sp. QT6929 TaxID=2975055 RepID=UPI0024B383D7|nr:regulatory protein RecX [Cysteiniphilum sp. QT6929]WHN64954.1 recombination regulator RecX [Cysteiniphilum sp. QT6929]
MPKNNSERDYLFYLLSKQEYCYAQLKQKLIQRNHIPLTEIESLLQEFVDNQWQSDERCAELMIKSALYKHYGLLRIKQKLVYEKGIDITIFEKVLNELDVDWFEQAHLCYQKKYHDKAQDQKEKQKRLQYLQRQGHSLGVALEVVSS